MVTKLFALELYVAPELYPIAVLYIPTERLVLISISSTPPIITEQCASFPLKSISLPIIIEGQALFLIPPLELAPITIAPYALPAKALLPIVIAFSGS